MDLLVYVSLDHGTHGQNHGSYMVYGIIYGHHVIHPTMGILPALNPSQLGKQPML
jgi:hypothetical protein